MAGIMLSQVLRQHIQKHWTRESPDCAPPIIGDEEKAAVRAALPAGLADPTSKLRTAVGLAVAAIAKWDCPDAWPDLLSNLLRAINQTDNQPLGASHRPEVCICQHAEHDTWHTCWQNSSRQTMQRAAVHGALQCLASFADELSDEQVAQVIIVAPCARTDPLVSERAHTRNHDRMVRLWALADDLRTQPMLLWCV